MYKEALDAIRRYRESDGYGAAQERLIEELMGAGLSYELADELLELEIEGFL